ncbi:hypothetical protein DHX103_10860 [Planococcus sp. X10-3]|uniref:hypothetical protein n=1 Tax=Planococcus sp. X10-3 TaxID=3061240 RepID=UPI003BAE3A57
MKKRLFIVLASLAVLIGIGYLIMVFMFYYDPTPNKSDVENMVNERDLADFGEVEGAFLLTPRNYGYYNDDRIYLVEQYFDKGREYGDQYVVIDGGVEITGEDEQAIIRIQAEEEFLDAYTDDLQLISKHRMRVYKNDEKVMEDWLFKITYKYGEDYFLTFFLPETVGEDRFNFFTEGYETFLEF